MTTELHEITYFETNSTDPAYNLAFEEYLLTHYKTGDCLMLWQNDNAVIVGQHQNTEAEIHREFVEKHHIRVVRRNTGGGAVFHDLGNLNYSFITDAGDQNTLSMERFSAPVIRALRDLGVPAVISGRNDILVDGKKVSGTAQRLHQNRILHHGTLLFDTKPEMIEQALRVNPLKFQSRSAKSVKSRVGNIRDYLAKDMTLREFWDYLKGYLTAEGLLRGRLAQEDHKQIDQLRIRKYENWQWNFGQSPKYGLSNSRRFDGGILEVEVSVEEGRIRELSFWGDFLGMHSLQDICRTLKGCVFRREDVAIRLKKFPLEEYFGSISEREILDTIFFVS